MDTSVWVDFFRGADGEETRWLRGQLGREAVGVTDLIACEMLQGARPGAMLAAVEADLGDCVIWEGCGAAMARKAAENYRILRGAGCTVRGTIDCLTATFCIERGHALLHRDRDFDPFEELLGLHVVRPLLQR